MKSHKKKKTIAYKKPEYTMPIKFEQTFNEEGLFLSTDKSDLIILCNLLSCGWHVDDWMPTSTYCQNY